MDQLTELLAKYAAVQPNAARGGLAALSGFDYQIRLYLADFVSALASHFEFEREGERFINAFEALADFTRAKGNQLVCVQAKTRFNKSTARKAAVEFCRIDEFLELSGNATLRANIRYELVAREAEHAVPWISVTLPEDVTARHGDFIGRWQLLISEGRVLEPRIDFDPWWRLIASIFPIIRDPFGFARRSLDRCLRFGRDVGAAAAVRDAIAEDFAASLLQTFDFAELVSHDDVIARPDGSREIILAATPTMDHLRRGFFMSRKQHITEVVALVDSVVANRSRNTETCDLDILWIQGRSGTGKSVLLLELLQYLRIERNATIVWLGNSVHKLSELFAQLKCTDEFHMGPEFVFVDDLYDPQSRDDLEISKLVTRAIHSAGIQWPIIVTCGPTEFRQALERDTRAEGMRLHTYTLNPMESAETNALVRWFENRSGAAVSFGPAITQPNALMLSVIFEMKHGDLRPFAHRFAARLQSQRLHEILRIPLAMNRLYIWIPATWLSSDEQIRLDTLNQDGDFALINRELRFGYLRLSHPHLSDSIYRTIYENQSPKAAAVDIVTAFEWALSTDFATALRLLRAVASDHARLAIADQRELGAGMSAALSKFEDVIRSKSKYEAAFFWCSWVKWAARDGAVSILTAKFSPVTRAIDAIDSTHAYWARLWKDLWECAPGHPELKRNANIWLREHQGEIQWSLPWKILTEYEVTRAAESGENVAAGELIALGWEWVTGHSDSSGSSWVLECLLQNHEHLLRHLSFSNVHPFVYEWLEDHPEGLDWNFVWRAFLRAALARREFDEAKNIYEVGWKWQETRVENPGWPFILQELLLVHTESNSQLDISRIRKIGWQWLNGRENHPAAPHVRIALLRGDRRAQRISNEALEPILKWLAENGDNPRWHSNWTSIFDGQKRNIDATTFLNLFQIGQLWLEGRKDHERYPAVWEQLFVGSLNLSDQGETDSLAEIGLGLVIDVSIPSWVNIFFHLIRWLKRSPEKCSEEVKSTLVGAGKRWLLTAGRQENLGWVQVYRSLFKFDYDEAYVDLGIQHLFQQPMRFSAHFAGFLLSQKLSDDGVIRIAEWLTEWFETKAVATRGISVWLKLQAVTNERLASNSSYAWRVLKTVLDANRPAEFNAWEELYKKYRAGEPVRGRVLKTHRIKGRKDRLGFVVDIGVNAFLPLHEANVPNAYSRQDFVGRDIEVEIVMMDEQSGRVDLSQLRFRSDQKGESIKPLTVGAEVSGVVTRVSDYGVFVDIGPVRAFLHASEINRLDAREASTVLRKGQVIRAKVLSIDAENSKVWLTLKSNPIQPE